MEGVSGGCWHRAGSWHSTETGSCSQLSLLAQHWGSAVPSHGAPELRTPVGARSWQGEAKPHWVRGAVGTCWGALGRWAPLPSCLGLSRKPSRWCFHGVKKQHMSPDPRRVAAAAMPPLPRCCGDAHRDPEVPAVPCRSSTALQQHGSLLPGESSTSPLPRPRRDGNPRMCRRDWVRSSR